MATIVDALLVTFGLETSGVDKGISEAKQKISGGMKNIFSALSAPLMGAMAAFSAGAAVDNFLSTATGLQQLSDSLGMSMESLQGWQYAAESAGASAEEVGNFFRDMNDYIVDATTFDSGPLKDIAKELGISLTDIQGNVRATEDVTLELADAFQRVGSQQAVAFGMQMGIDPGMIQLLQKGGDEIRKLIGAQMELGTYTKEDAEIATQAKMAIMTLGKSIESAALPLVRAVIPALTWLAEKMTSVTRLIRENSQFVKIALLAAAGVITAAFVPSLTAMGLAGAKAMLPFLPLIALVGGLALIIDDLITYINGGNSAFSGLWSQFGTGEEILTFFQDTWAGLLEGIKKLQPLIPMVLSIGAGFAAFKTAISIFTGVATAIRGVSVAFNVLKVALMANPIGLIIGAVMLLITYWDEVAAGAQKVGAVISSAFSGAAEFIKGIWDGVIGWFQEKFQWITDTWNKISSIPGTIANTIGAIGKAGSWVMGLFGGEEGAEKEAIPPSTTYNANNSSQSVSTTATTTIGTINVTNGDTKDGQALGTALGEAVNKSMLTQASDTGVRM